MGRAFSFCLLVGSDDLDVVAQIREGRVLRCTANYGHISALAAFLIEECCADQSAPQPAELETTP